MTVKSPPATKAVTENEVPGIDSRCQEANLPASQPWKAHYETVIDLNMSMSAKSWPCTLASRRVCKTRRQSRRCVKPPDAHAVI